MRSVRHAISQAVYLWKSTGALGLLRRAVTKLVSPIYQRHDYYIANHYIDHDAARPGPESGPGAVRGVAIDSVEAIDAVADRLHPFLSAEELRGFLAESPKRFLILAEYTEPDGTLRYVGCRTCEQGMFAVGRGRQHGEISNETIMIYNNEIAPEFRGQRITQRTRPGMYEHCRRIGVNRTTSVIAVHNLASVRAHTKASEGMITTLNGRITCVQWLGGLIVRKTPWGRVRELVEAPPPHDEPGHARPSTQIPS